MTTDCTLLSGEKGGPSVGTFLILNADELKARDSWERQAARRAARQQLLVRRILRMFLEHGEPIDVEKLVAALPDGQPGAGRQSLMALDEEDVIRVRAGQIDLAYPFSAVPTPFRVRLPDGRERYACCAVDALGMAPMIGESIEIGSHCHHCGAALVLTATPDGPGPEADGLMVWFGSRGDARCKVADSL